MDDNISPQVKWAQEVGCRKGCINHQLRGMLTTELGRCSDITQAEEGIRDRLDEERTRALLGQCCR
jgi:hypothetical protein